MPVEEGGYGMSLMALGNLYWAAVISVLIGEVLGHYGNDVSHMRFQPLSGRTLTVRSSVDCQSLPQKAPGDLQTRSPLATCLPVSRSYGPWTRYRWASGST